jgi:3-deoxy-D-manno-octulosonate 8-phosphate phosphatase (KDO 8-P phosphatase)
MTDPCSPSPTEYLSDCDLLDRFRTRVRTRGEQELDPARQRALLKAAEIELLLLDVDGVLTDGRLTFSASGEETKSFHATDGLGLQLLREAGIQLGIITRRNSAIVERRAAELHISHCHQGVLNKKDVFREILRTSGLKPFQVAYMGDDWVDLGVLLQVGLALAPANAVPEVKEAVHYVTAQEGGSGAVREVCELILAGKKKLEPLLQQYRNR